MIQDIFPKVYNNAYMPCLPELQDFVMIFSGKKVLVKNTDGNVDLPRFADLPPKANCRREQCRFLFAVSEEKFFLAADLDLTFVNDNIWQWKDQTVFRGMIGDYKAFAGITAAQLNRWYNDNKYCGGCGGAMLAGTKERSLICEKCGKIIYPRINPAVIIAVTDGSRLLMTQYANGNYKRYALVAGFVEIGETFEQTVIREVREEVGLQVKNVRYFGSQPWSFSDSVMIAFSAELDGSDRITLQREELAAAKWFEKEDIPKDMRPISIGYDLVQAFINNEL